MLLGKTENIFGAQGVPMSLPNPQYSRGVDRDCENMTLWEASVWAAPAASSDPFLSSFF